MRYLTEDKVDELLDAVKILPISDEEVGDISQYFLTLERLRNMHHLY